MGIRTHLHNIVIRFNPVQDYREVYMEVLEGLVRQIQLLVFKGLTDKFFRPDNLVFSENFLKNILIRNTKPGIARSRTLTSKSPRAR